MWLNESLRLFYELNLGYWLNLVFEKYAVLAVLMNEDAAAAALLGYVDHQNATLGRARQANELRSYDRVVLLLRGRLGDREFEHRHFNGSDLAESDATAYISALEARVPASRPLIISQRIRSLSKVSEKRCPEFS